jgi:hypothetical protein
MSYREVGFATRMGSGEAPPAKKFPTGSSLLVIDSDDRNLSTSLPVNPSTGETQPWNNFQITLPDRLITGAVNSLMLREVVFPWAIPNITPLNNTMVISSAGAVPFIYNISLKPGFYTPSDLAGSLNDQMGTYIVVSWNEVNSAFDWSAVGIAGQTVNFDVTGITTVAQFIRGPNLMKTLGFSYGQLANPLQVPAGNNNLSFYTGSTSCLYTSYVDIVSTRVNQYRKLQDGASKNASRNRFVTRLYCANETSTNPTTGYPVGTEYFVINRQFKEKVIQWSPEGTIDTLDFQVLDEYGNLVWIPANYNINRIVDPPNPDVIYFAPPTYPGFKMTFVVVSEE